MFCCQCLNWFSRFRDNNQRIVYLLDILVTHCCQCLIRMSRIRGTVFQVWKTQTETRETKRVDTPLLPLECNNKHSVVNVWTVCPGSGTVINKLFCRLLWPCCSYFNSNDYVFPCRASSLKNTKVFAIKTISRGRSVSFTTSIQVRHMLGIIKMRAKTNMWFADAFHISTKFSGGYSWKGYDCRRTTTVLSWTIRYPRSGWSMLCRKPYPSPVGVDGMMNTNTPPPTTQHHEELFL